MGVVSEKDNGIPTKGVAPPATKCRAEWDDGFPEGRTWRGDTEDKPALDDNSPIVGKAFRVDDLMSGAGALVKLHTLTCLALTC